MTEQMNWAQAELAKDNQKEELKILKSQYTAMELDLVKTKQNFAEALNAVYEYEKKNTYLKQKVLRLAE